MSIALPSGGKALGFARVQTWRSPLLWISVLTAVTVVIQYFNPGVSDVSWLLVIADRVLHGERLYVDILEVNPPASFMLYLPAALAERYLGIQAEYAVIGLTAAGLILALWSAGRLLIRHDLLKEPASAAFAAVLAFGVVAGNSYGQREHIALIALLPILALAACRASRARVECSSWQIFVIGAVAGCAVAIKPQFALPILCSQIFAAWRRRSPRPFFQIENWAILVVVLLYLGSTIIYFPGFWTNVFPLLAQTYLPARVPMMILLFIVSPFLLLTMAYMLFAPPARLSVVQAISLAAGAGFLLGCLQQAKGWSYHYYPAVALFLFVVIFGVIRELFGENHAITQRQYRDLRVALAIVLLAVTAVRFVPHVEASRSLEPAIRDVVKHPRILSISPDLGVGNPLTRQVGGTYVGTTVAQWISSTAQYLLHQPGIAAAQQAKLRLLIDRDRAILRTDVARKKPEIILGDMRGDWMAWVRGDAQLCAMMSRYRLDAANKDVALFVRNDLPGAGNAATIDGDVRSRVRNWGCGVVAPDEVIRR